ncbi:hypothetical protein GW17_00055969 [Ensete ventricosum]|nr:hypothetical protein GW17_00055969 [Ensete ventricosum]
MFLFDSADRKWGKGKDKIDDEDITFQRMVAKVSQSALLFVIVSFLPILYVTYSVLITCPGRDIGFSCWAVDASRCRKLLVNVEATFMGEGVLAFPFSNDIMCLYDIANFIVVCFQLWTVMTCYI